MRKPIVRIILTLFLLMLPATVFADGEETSQRKPITLRAWRMWASIGVDVHSLVVLKIIEAFKEKYPDIIPESPEGLEMPTSRMTHNIVPLMQIAGDIAPHVLRVDFNRSDTYIQNKLLYPLDKYFEKESCP